MKKTIPYFLTTFLCGILLIEPAQFAFAQPFGDGNYGANVGYGSQTALTISTDGNVTIPLNASSAGTLGTATSHVTVVSNDVTGYYLYLRALTNASLTNGANFIPASNNVTPSALSTDTWGYNTDGSTNFSGISTSDTLIHTLTGPAPNGDTTTVTYGVKIDFAKAAGSYQSTVIYTAVPQTD